MKLSVCIPVYNHDVRELVYALKAEIESRNLAVEIILIDDASEKEFRILNSEIQDKVTRFLWLEKNIGRSQIRNLFLQYSDGDYLLFLDCDVTVAAPDFLQKYLAFISDHKELKAIYGGFQENAGFHNLRSRYSRAREIQPLEYRRKHPYATFKGVNFIIQKAVLAKYPFNESITQYGYEDFLFAKTLQTNQIPIFHLQNPVLHYDESSDEAFLEKTDMAVKTLSKLLQDKETAPLVKHIKLVKFYLFLKKTGTLPLATDLLIRNKNLIRRKILSGGDLKYLDLYKLLLLAIYMK